MNNVIKNCILKGFEKTKKEIEPHNVHKIISENNLEQHFPFIERVAAHYIREYEEGVRSKKTGDIFMHTHSVIKTLMHLRYLSADENKVNRTCFGGNLIPYELLYANEILCWNVLFEIYEFFINDIHTHHKNVESAESPPFCDLHFEETKWSFVIALFHSRNRLSDITPGYIELLFRFLIQRHSNISANRVENLLNRTGFITYLLFLGRKTGTLSLMCCDIDKFKQVNDMNSHKKGDDVLRQVANVLDVVCKKHCGIPARVGGEEFWLAFYRSESVADAEQELTQIFKEIREELKGVERPNPDPASLSSGEYREYMTISVAGGSLPRMAVNISEEIIGEWFDKLDAGVRKVKASGRDNFEFVCLA
jgi:diguanylate cyclase (GGDEF)-like protein